METYLVGGAVRDQLLGYPYSERDWVVVGTNPDRMIELGYTPVGKDFPVFLHPETKEEYALARTERKTAPGYTGFSVHSDPSVTLEQDLARRDLTINAIARDERGELVDPYGGVKDLREKRLRHVSPAFAEDPVRILRVARFAARYHHLGFTLAGPTLEMMRQMVSDGEADHLVPERVWKELSRALGESDPHVFLQVLRDCGALEAVMPEVDALFGVPQPEKHHPEVDTGVHTLMTLEQAALLSDELAVRFAALCHDLGKGKTPRAEWPRHIAHEKRGLEAVQSLCRRLGAPNDCRDLALMACEFHTHVHRALTLKPATVAKLFQQTDAYRRPERFLQLLLVCESDARGRTGFETRDYPQRDYLTRALQASLAVNAKPFVEQGYRGGDIGQQIDRARLDVITRFKQSEIL